MNKTLAPKGAGVLFFLPRRNMNKHFSNFFGASIVLLVFIVSTSAASCRLFNSEQRNAYDKIKFEKSACLNNCKAYFIEIDNKGYARFREPGKQERNLDFQLTKKEFRDLMRLLTPKKISSLKDEHDFGDEDTQQKFLTLYSGNKNRVIRFGRAIPDHLKMIEAQFDLIVSAHKTAK